MKSRTSFFSWAAFRKDITRFAPVWALYTVFLMMCLALLITNNTKGYNFSYTLAASISMMPIANICYALLCAQLLFGDLYNTRMCNALHAMPLRREGWFLTHVLAGICFSFFPNLLFSLLNYVFLEQFWRIAVFWLLAVMLQYLFFFGLAVFSALCVGSRFAMALVYAIVNFLSMLVCWLMDTLYLPLLYGVTLETEPFCLLCPVVQMVDSSVLSVQSINGVYHEQAISILSEGWIYLGICAGVGIILFILAVLLYRRRKLECAGDFMAIPKLSPVFLVLYSLAMGALFQVLCQIFSNGNDGFVFLSLCVGILAGFFTGQMLLKRTVRVFKPKIFLGFAVFAAVFGTSLGLTEMDPLGIESWVPETAEVSSASITSNGYVSSCQSPEDIENVIQIQREALRLQNLSEYNSGSVRFTLQYILKSGRTVSRSYILPAATQGGQLLRGFLSRPDCVIGMAGDDWDSFLASINKLSLESTLIYDQEDISSLMEAVRLDCRAGNMAQNWEFHQDSPTVYWLEIWWLTSSHLEASLNLRIYSSAENVLAWMEAHDIVPESEMSSK